MEIGRKPGLNGKYIEGNKGLFGGKSWGYTPDKLFIDFDRVGTSTVLHEFGHALGHVHMVNSSHSIMSYDKERRTNFNSEEINSIIRAYR